MKTSRHFNLTARSAFPSSRLIAFLIAALVFIVIPMSGQSPRLAKQSPSAISQAKAAPTDTITDPAIESEADFVSYTHAVGVSSIDEPIAIYKSDVSIFPHTGWRGMLGMGTYANGAQSDCPVVNPCDRIEWPGSNVTIDGRGYARDEPTKWYGSLASNGSEGSGLQYMRNRYYDPSRGQFTQADPIGLGGGLNLYGFAEGDPVTYADPFGLYPYVQCRLIEGGLGFSHCAVRVVNVERNLDVMIELVPEMHDGNRSNEVWWHSAKGFSASDAARDKYSPSGWIRVAPPNGISEGEFDNAVLGSALRQTMAVRGQSYSARGEKNSNHFVYETITGAGAKIPKAAVRGKAAPGLCGGSGLKNGTNCSPP